jgi:pSer/pThr/pTyr-binding forkhead associated (FHA) protein
MPKLIIKFNNEVVDHLDIKQGDMKVGRRPGCDIFLDNLAVSGEHANIFTIGDDSFIQDLGSTNGTFINNKKITKHHLRNGDAVVIGKHTMVYFTEQQEVAPNDFAKTVIINPAVVREAAAASAAAAAAATARPAPTPPPTAVAPTPKADLQGALVMLNGASTGKRIELTKSVTNLGKTGKRAGAINKTDDGFVLVAGDEGEAPKLNGRPIGAEGTVLKNGDVIDVAGARLQFLSK